jgi:biopolymer transport protein ExbD
MLPAASEARPLTVQPKEMFINVDHRGHYFVDGKTLNGDEVERVLEQAVVDNPVNQSVIIRADKRVQLDFVVFVMNACNKVGIFDYSLTIQGEGG